MEEIKYLINGQMVWFKDKTSGGKYLVTEALQEQYDDGSLIPGELMVVDRIFDEPPVVIFDQKISDLNLVIADLDKQITDKRTELSDLGNEGRDLLAKYGKYQALKKLNDYIEGKITHFFIGGWTNSIQTFEEAMKDGRDTRLLSLFGDSKGDLLWRVNWYRDGSGSWQTCIPCTSYDEARKHAQDHINDYILKEGRVYEKLIRLAVDHNLHIDKHYIDKFYDNRRLSLETDLKKLRAQVADKEQEIQEFDNA